MYCCTTLRLHLIPKANADALLAVASTLSVAQITPERFGENSIDAALLKILSQGEAIESLGLGFIPFDEAKTYPHQDEIVRLLLPIDLRNASDEFPHYASAYYPSQPGLPFKEIIVHTIRHGELNDHEEVFVSEEKQHPLSQHDEIARRGIVDAAYLAWRARVGG